MSTETKPLSKAAQKRAEQAEAVEYLHGVLKPNDGVYVIQRHLSSSGMMRRLSLLVIRDSKPLDITRKAALAMGSTYDPDYGTIKVTGAGMNMHFATVYGLSRVLFPDGHPCTGSRGCPSNDHSNDYGTFQREFYDALEAKGEPRLGYEEEGGEAQFEAMRAHIDARLAKSYDTSRVHSDGGYALHHVTL